MEKKKQRANSSARWLGVNSFQSTRQCELKGCIFHWFYLMDFDSVLVTFQASCVSAMYHIIDDESDTADWPNLELSGIRNLYPFMHHMHCMSYYSAITKWSSHDSRIIAVDITPLKGQRPSRAQTDTLAGLRVSVG